MVTKSSMHYIKALTISITAFILTLTLSSGVLAGEGYIEEGDPDILNPGQGTPHKLNLIVNFDYDGVNEDDLNTWGDFFNEASKVLYNAMEGQMQIGTVKVLINCPLVRDTADVVISDDYLGYRGELGYSNGWMGDRQNWGAVTLFQHIVDGPEVAGEIIAHELSHYVFHLYDEYFGKEVTEDGQRVYAALETPAYSHWCNDDPSGSACLMDASLLGIASEWCTPSGGQSPSGEWYADWTTAHHDGILYYCDQGECLWHMNRQEWETGESCWDTIEDVSLREYKIEIRMPDTQPSTDDLANDPDCSHQDINWIVSDCQVRELIVLDTRMTESHLILAKAGARMLVDRALVGQELGIGYYYCMYPFTGMYVFPLGTTYFGETTEISVSYNNVAGADDYEEADGEKVCYETFTAPCSFALTSASLYGYPSGSPGTVNVSIRHAENGVTEVPDPYDLISLSFDANVLGPSPDWHTQSFEEPYQLQAGVRYALVVSAPDGDSANTFRWMEDPLSLYPDGKGCYGYPESGPWACGPLDDYLFSISGIIESGPPDRTMDYARNSIDSIQKFDGPDWPSIRSGVSLAYQWLCDAGEPAAVEKIVLFTDDGGHCIWRGCEWTLPGFGERGVRVYTIAIGPFGDTELSVDRLETLEELAAMTNGGSYFVENEEELNEILETVSNDVGGNIVITESSDVISTGEFIERSVFIDEFSDAVIFSLNWPGSDLDLTLRKPNGTVIDPSLAAVNFNIEYVERSNYEFYRVRSPMDGEWDLIVEAVNVACSEPFTVQITSEGKEVIFTASAQEPQITYPDSIAIRASVIAGDRVANAEVTGIVNRPDGSSVDLTLHDDGLEIHGDTHADDGTYSNFFSGYTINGIYTFDLVVNNQEGVEAVWPFAEPPPEGWTPGSIAPFRREASVLVIVSGVPEVPEEVSFNVWIVIGPAIGALLLSLVIYYMARRRTGVQRAT